jgi:AraC-like DNA-binding protein
VAAFRDYVSVYSPSLRIDVVDHLDPRFAVVELRITLEPSPPELRQTTELTLGVTRRILGLVVGPTFRPVTVHIPHDPLTPPAEYVAYFGSAVKFRESFCGLTIRRSDLDKPLAGDNSAHEALRAYLNSIAQPGLSTEIEAVQLLARHLLPTGLTIKLVAQHLGLHPRTLQRRLAAQSTTYEQVVDQTRKELAARLLRDTDMPVSQLARVLGYSEQSVLVGSTHRWFGSTPSGYRKSVRQQTAPK